ncbi:MAG: hypothetical protein ACRDTT_17805 [Pseudonocardiaceae bacterium]
MTQGGIEAPMEAKPGEAARFMTANRHVTCGFAFELGSGVTIRLRVIQRPTSARHARAVTRS